jgi:ABC-type spermidine/putrescine transport system permease subunit II
MSSYMPSERFDEMEGLVRILHASGVQLMLIYLLRTVLRLIGAIGLWRGRQSGFHLYAGAQLLGLFLPHVILPLSLLGFFGPLMTVGITALYGSQYKRLS